MKAYRWQLGFGLGLVALSILFYGMHFFFFRNMHHILIYLVGDIAFLPAEVLLVSLVIHELLALREKRARRHGPYAPGKSARVLPLNPTGQKLPDWSGIYIGKRKPDALGRS